jgi:hypothetical protein
LPSFPLALSPIAFLPSCPLGPLASLAHLPRASCLSCLLPLLLLPSALSLSPSPSLVKLLLRIHEFHKGDGYTCVTPLGNLKLSLSVQVRCVLFVFFVRFSHRRPLYLLYEELCLVRMRRDGHAR